MIPISLTPGQMALPLPVPEALGRYVRLEFGEADPTWYLSRASRDGEGRRPEQARLSRRATWPRAMTPVILAISTIIGRRDRRDHDPADPRPPAVRRA